MSFDDLDDLNWLAVIVAALAYFALGAIWYAPPVFGKTWASAGGLEIPEDQRPPTTIYLVPLIGSVLSAIALGVLAVTTDTNTVSEGLMLGILVAVGFAIPIAMVTATFETSKPKPMVWGAINGGYHVVGTLVAAVILATWQ